MLQGVHELYELNETPQLWEEHSRISRLVFIGKETNTSFTCFIFTQILTIVTVAAEFSLKQLYCDVLRLRSSEDVVSMSVSYSDDYLSLVTI